MDKSEILNSNFAELGFSEDFCVKSKLMGFCTISEVIHTRPATLLKKNNFSYVWLTELTAFLDKHGLLSMLQPIPGRNFG